MTDRAALFGDEAHDAIMRAEYAERRGDLVYPRQLRALAGRYRAYQALLIETGDRVFLAEQDENSGHRHERIERVTMTALAAARREMAEAPS